MRVFVCVHIVFVCMFVCLCMCVVYVYMYACMCMYVCVCVCVYLSMYVPSNRDKQCEILYNFAELAKTFEYENGYSCVCVCVCCVVFCTDVFMRRSE